MNSCLLPDRPGLRPVIPRASRARQIAGVLSAMLVMTSSLGVAVPQAPASGLSDDEMAKVHARFNSLSNNSAALQDFCQQFDRDSLGAFLLQVIQEDALESYPLGRAFEMLGVMEYRPAAAPLRKIMEGFIQEGQFQATLSDREWSRLHGAIIALGYVGGETALPFLRQWVTVDFWEQRGGAPAREKSPDSEDSKRSNQDHFRLMALQAVAEVGTQEVVDYFTNPKNLPEDLASNQDWLLSIAQRRLAGTFWTDTGDAGCVVPEPAGCFVRTTQ